MIIEEKVYFINKLTSLIHLLEDQYLHKSDSIQSDKNLELRLGLMHLTTNAPKTHIFTMMGV